MSEYHICLTGHRPDRLAGYDITRPQYKKLKEALQKYIEFLLTKHEVLYCHTGLALGADTVWSLAIIEELQLHPDRVFLIAEVPYKEQSDNWTAYRDKKNWSISILHATKIYEYDKEFSKHANKQTAAIALQNRNVGMIDHSDEVLTLLRKGTMSGGTYNAVQYAKAINKKITPIEVTAYFN